VSTAEIAQAYKNSNTAMEQIRRVEDTTNDGMSYFDDEVKTIKTNIRLYGEHIKDLVVGHAQVRRASYRPSAVTCTLHARVRVRQLPRGV
jgi:hypothetical protein